MKQCKTAKRGEPFSLFFVGCTKLLMSTKVSILSTNLEVLSTNEVKMSTKMEISSAKLLMSTKAGILSTNLEVLSTNQVKMSTKLFILSTKLETLSTKFPTPAKVQLHPLIFQHPQKVMKLITMILIFLLMLRSELEYMLVFDWLCVYVPQSALVSFELVLDELDLFVTFQRTQSLLQ